MELSDFNTFFNVIVDFLFSSNYGIFGLPLALYLLIPIVAVFVAKLLKRGRE